MSELPLVQNYIDGEDCAAAGGESIELHEPATGQVYARVADSDAADLERAVEAARAAKGEWRSMLVEQRARLLAGLGALIERDADALARAECVDTGKPLSLAREIEIPRAAANLRFFAAAITQFHSESHAMAAGALNYTLRQPHGIVACISPWNLPLYLFTWKIAPALAAGNCVIAKPSELAPATAGMFSALCREAGLPPGVLNVLHGRGERIGQAIVEHPAISAVSFTGGTLTGARVAAAAAPAFKKLSLELGGKNPTILFDDCDLSLALEHTLNAAFRNQGQICLCGSRILVQRGIYDEVARALSTRADALRTGDPFEPETRQGALISREHRAKVEEAIAGAVAYGGRILCGGTRPSLQGRCRDGYFLRPTLIDGLDPRADANQREIFGPVATLLPFEDENEALALANDVAYGLAASVFSRDNGRCHRMAAGLESGLVWINNWMLRDLRTPMGGTKASGLGREGGFEALRFFTESKNVCVSYA